MSASISANPRPNWTNLQASAATRVVIRAVGDFKAKMISQGWVANAGNAEDKAARMIRDGNQWGTIIKQHNVQLD